MSHPDEETLSQRQLIDEALEEVEREMHLAILETRATLQIARAVLLLARLFAGPRPAPR